MGRYDFLATDYSDEPSPGETPSVPLAIGGVVIGFEELDDQLSTAIGFLLRRGDDVGRCVTAELSFKAKVNLFGSLFRHDRPSAKLLDELSELCSGCLQVEEERNRIVHSNWRGDVNPARMQRVKFTARGKHGLRRQAETTSPGRVSAVWAHCGFLAHSVDELMYREYGLEYGQP